MEKMFEILEKIERTIDEMKKEELENMSEEDRRELKENEEKIKEILEREDIKQERKLLAELISKSLEEHRTILLKGTAGDLQVNLDGYAIYTYDIEGQEQGMMDLGNGIREAMALTLGDETAMSVLREAIDEPTKISIDIERL